MRLTPEFTKQPAMTIDSHESDKIFRDGVMGFVADAKQQIVDAVASGQMKNDDFALCKFNNHSFPLKPGDSVAQALDSYYQENHKGVHLLNLDKLPETLRMIKNEMMAKMASDLIPPEHAASLAKKIIGLEKAGVEGKFGEEHGRDMALVLARVQCAAIFYPKEPQPVANAKLIATPPNSPP